MVEGLDAGDVDDVVTVVCMRYGVVAGNLGAYDGALDVLPDGRVLVLGADGDAGDGPGGWGDGDDGVDVDGRRATGSGGCWGWKA